MNFREKYITEVIDTPRLSLYGLTPEIYDAVFRQLTDAELIAFFGLEADKDLDSERYKYQQGLTMYRISFRTFLMVDRERHRVIGRIGYHYWYVPHKRAEIGYAISQSENMGKGYMKEALTPVVKYGFNVMGLNKIVANIGPQNEGSIRLVTQVGFKQEGYLREDYNTGDGILQDSICYGLLRSEYPEKETGK